MLNMMLKKVAEMLNRREIGSEVTPEIREFAKKHGIVIVYGASDDLMEFDGAWTDEVYSYEGGEVYVTSNGVFERPKVCKCDVSNEEKCPYLAAALRECAVIEVVWGEDEACIPWTYETSIPHETFGIMEDGEIYCQGIVFYADKLL